MFAPTQYKIHIISTYEEVTETNQQALTAFGEALREFGYSIASYENLIRKTITREADINQSKELQSIWLYILNSSKGFQFVKNRLQEQKNGQAILLIDKTKKITQIPEWSAIIQWNESEPIYSAKEVNKYIKDVILSSNSLSENLYNNSNDDFNNDSNYPDYYPDSLREYIVVSKVVRIYLNQDNDSQIIDVLHEGEVVNAYTSKNAGLLFTGEGFIDVFGISETIEIQKSLNSLLPLEHRIIEDGKFGPSTESAIKLFQEKYQIEVTGILSNATYLKLYELINSTTMPISSSYWLLKLNPEGLVLDEFKPGYVISCSVFEGEDPHLPDLDLFRNISDNDTVYGYAIEQDYVLLCHFRVKKAMKSDTDDIELVVEERFPELLPFDKILGILPISASLTGQSAERLFLLSEVEVNALGQLISGKSTSTTPSSPSVGYLASSKFFIRDTVEPTLGVQDIAAEVAELIRNLRNNTSDKGRMVGVFGNWGRGKTFLAGQVFKELEKDPFIRVDFHAWKYQDTHASWAYLYEAFARKYFDKPKSVKGFIGRFRHDFNKRFRLNFMRRGSAPLVRLGVSIAVIIFSAFIASWYQKNEYLLKGFWLLLTGAGLFDVSRLLVQYFRENKIKERATEVFKQYYEKPTFKDILGVQSEIQSELRNLLKCWVGNPKSPDHDKQILLFVDDIDRCSEDRMIQIIDALRVMLDDEEISKRVIVVAAIDERVLRRAIKWKYKELLDADRSLSIAENGDIGSWKNTTLQITSEYMDKLFIAGIKLGTLNRLERQAIFEGLSKNKVQAEVQPVIPQSSNKTEEIPAPQTPVTDSRQAEPEQKPEQQDSRMMDELIVNFRAVNAYNGQKRKHIFSTEKPESPSVQNFEFTHVEYTYLLKLVEELTTATPRQIRIFYYRYLLARNLLTIGLRQSGTENNYPPEKRNGLLAQLLVHYTNLHSNQELLSDRSAFHASGNDLSKITVGHIVTGYEDNLIAEALETLEMVIAY
jgi:KAP family P-loop domain/Putative peptidoglycan binding domain